MGAVNPRSIILAGSSGVRFSLRLRNGLLNSRKMSLYFMCRPKVRISLKVWMGRKKIRRAKSSA